MSEKSDNIWIELHAMIDDADRRITDSNANRFGAGENAKNGPCAPPLPSRFAGDIGGCPPDVKQSTKTGRANGEAACKFSFGPFHLIPTQRLLLEAGKPLRLGSRALDILIALVERHGELLSKEELTAWVWPKMFVEPSNLTVHVAALRRVLGDGRNGKRYLVNIPGRGYRFIAPVRVADEAMPSLPQLQPIVTSGANNLPAQDTRLVGRAEALRTLAAQLSEQCFITIVGPGGISVALAVTEAVAGSDEHGVWIVDLTRCDCPATRLGASTYSHAAATALLGAPDGAFEPTTGGRMRLSKVANDAILQYTGPNIIVSIGCNDRSLKMISSFASQ